jgi:hypothetical protein
MATNQQATTEELLEAVFLWSAPQPLLHNNVVNTSLQQQIQTQ